jgi:hypothetical protein
MDRTKEHLRAGYIELGCWVSADSDQVPFWGEPSSGQRDTLWFVDGHAWKIRIEEILHCLQVSRSSRML